MLFSLIVLAPACLHAQRVARIDSGTAVRITTADALLRGRLLEPAIPGEALAYCRFPRPSCIGDSSEIVRMPWNNVLRLEVQSGNHWRTGVEIGGGFGLVLGAIAGGFAAGLCERSCPPSTGAAIALGSTTGAVLFGAVGALFGSAVPKWSAVGP